MDARVKGALELCIGVVLVMVAGVLVVPGGSKTQTLCAEQGKTAQADKRLPYLLHKLKAPRVLERLEANRRAGPRGAVALP